MKIKTITCHDVYNVGASLQAYALMRYLSDLGNDVEIIDYKPDYLSHHYQIFYADNPAYRTSTIKKTLYVVAKMPTKIKQQRRRRAFDKFTKENLKLTRRYTSNSELKQDVPEADVIIAGSDQIWNPLFENGRDPAFYLDFVPDSTIRASYAASFAVEDFPNEYAQSAYNWLKRFDYISVREKTGLNVLKHLGIENGVAVLDPVFLIDSALWENMAGKEPVIKDKYVLIYDFESSEVAAAVAKKIAEQLNMKIVSIFKTDYANINFLDAGPIEFLNLVKNAEFVVSNSFHATAFSLIFEKNFYVLGRAQKVNSRMMDLLMQLGLQERFVANRIESASCVDYRGVSSKLEKAIFDSKQYLQMIVTGE